MEIVLYILAAMAVLGLIIFIYEIKHATLIDDNEPFLYGDYDPKKDPTLANE